MSDKEIIEAYRTALNAQNSVIESLNQIISTLTRQLTLQTPPTLTTTMGSQTYPATPNPNPKITV